MDSNTGSAPAKTVRSRLLTIILLTGIIGLFAVIAAPNFFIHSGPSKISGIASHLRQIDAAKQQWAIDHGVTNSVQSDRELTPGDLAPYLLASYTRKDFGDPIYGEHYFINRLNESPKAQLTKDLREHGWPGNWKIPKGTVIVLVDIHEKFILPRHESEPPKSLAEILTKN